MKRIFTTFILIAAAALTFSSCEREEIANTESDSAITLHITASTIDTKTVFGDRVDGAYSVKWTADKQVAFSLNETTPVGVTPVVINEGAGASFDVTFTEGGETGTVYAFSPKGVYDSKNPENNQPGFTRVNSAYHDVYLNIPNVQTPLANSCDESAQALFASQKFNGADTEINMTFNHVVAYGKMAIKNFTGTIAKVDVVFPEPVCGTSCYYYYDGDDKGKVKNADVKNITLNPDNVVDNVFWFACAPTAGTKGSMKVIVTDNDDKTYTKTIDLTAKALPFTQGKVSSFGVDMTGIEADENIQVIPDGDYVILAKDGDNYYAVSADANGTTARRDRVSVTYNGGESFETTNSKLIWSFTSSDDTYTIANGTDYMGAAKNTIPLKTESNAADVTIVENEDGYTLTANCGADGTRYMAMNGANGFGWYASGTGVAKLYLVPATYAAPTFYNITVNATTNGTVLASKDQAEAGETITLTVTPNSGYTLATLTCNGADIASTKSFVMPAEDVTIAATFEEDASGDLKTWTYEVVQTSPTLNASNPATVNGATWSIVMGTLTGSPTTNGAPTKYSGIYGWKWGDSSSKYWKSYTLSTDYFASKQVKSVTVNILNNGNKSGTMTVMQGSTTIGTATATFGTEWTDLTANTTHGTSGTLTIEYAVAQASYIHSITVEYYD